MGLEKSYPDKNENIEPVLESNIEEPSIELIQDEIPASKKKGRPKKEKKVRTPAQLANDEKQRKRFKEEHEARKTKTDEPKSQPKPKPKAKPKSKPEKEDIVQEDIPQEDTPQEAENSGSEIDEETVYIKRKPRKKSKRTYVIEPSDSDSSEYEEENIPQRRRIPTPKFSENNDIFTLTFK